MPRACELFVPKVKGSTLCAMCGQRDDDHGLSPYSRTTHSSHSTSSPRVTPSENSAFTAYRKKQQLTDADVFPRRPLQRRAAPEPRLIAPRARKLISDKRSESDLLTRLKEEKKMRSSSAGTRLDDSDSDSPSPSRQPLEEPKRARNFHKILTRFQSASETSNVPRPQRRITVANVRLRDSPDSRNDSPPNSRPSSLHGRSPTRKNSWKANNNRVAVSSPISHYVPEAAIRSTIAYRTPSSESSHSLDPSPPIPRQVPLTIAIPPQAPKRQSLPSHHWVKETDIDDPSSFDNPLPVVPVIHEMVSDPSYSEGAPVVSATREIFERKPPLTGGCRRHTDYQNNLVYKRSKSRDDHTHDNHNHIQQGDRLEAGSVASRSSITASPGLTLSRARAVENAYSQICSGHLTTLSWLAEKLAERATKDPFSSSSSLFTSISFSLLQLQRSPTLIKGSSFFFDGQLNLDRKRHDVTVMIAPHSHYAPVIRKGMGVAHHEMEDVDGSISRFLREHTDDDPPSLKAVVLPRMNLCSLHALSAQRIDKEMQPDEFEAHVCFILIRLLSALKLLQADGIDCLSSNFREFLLVYRIHSTGGIDDLPQLLFLSDALEQTSEENGQDQVGLCRYALRALCTLLHHRMDVSVPRIANNSRHSNALLAAAKTLHEDKGSSLSTAQQLLELSLWGQGSRVEGDFEAKMWLDVRRAECVNQLLRCLAEESFGWEDRESLRVDFLLSTTPRALSSALSTLALTRFD